MLHIVTRLTTKVMNTAREGSISMLKNAKTPGISPLRGLMLLSAFSLALPSTLIGQKQSFGPSVGVYAPKITGGAVAGDVVVIHDPTTPNREAFLGFFYEISFSKHLSLRNSLLYRQQFLGFLVFNQAEQCTFCPVKKGASLATNTFELVILPRLRLVTYKKIDLYIFAGPSLQINTKFRPSESVDVSFGNKHPGVAEIVNQIDDAYRNFVIFGSYGLGVKYKRVSLDFRIQQLFSNSLTQKITFNNSIHEFNVDCRYSTFSLNYHFFSLHGKKNRHANP